jgi:hypothetical protein
MDVYVSGATTIKRELKLVEQRTAMEAVLSVDAYFH